MESTAPLTLIPGGTSQATDQDVAMEISPWKVRPGRFQPRKRFDESHIIELASSINEIGQITPGIVWKLNPEEREGEVEYELVDGECRLRACRLMNRAFKAFVIPGSDSFVLMLKSFGANFGRLGHTPLEITEALYAMRVAFVEKYHITIAEATERVAHVCCKSSSWVNHYIGLRGLCTEVQQLLDESKIKLQVAKVLESFTYEAQVRIVHQIVSGDMNTKVALRFVSKQRTPENLGPSAHKRNPHDDYKVLRGAVLGVEESAEHVIGLSPKEVDRIFENRTTAELGQILDSLEESQKALAIFQETVEAQLAKKKEKLARAREVAE